MGILGLAKLIADVAPSSFKQGEIKQYFGKPLMPSLISLLISYNESFFFLLRSKNRHRCVYEFVSVPDRRAQ